MFNIYVTSPDRKDGKTFLSTGIAAIMQSLGYNTCFFKPVQTSGIEINGFTQSPDITLMKSLDPYVGTHFSYLFKEKEEPLIASENDNEFIDLDLINAEYKRITENFDCTVVDGECGILSPLAPSVQNTELIKKLQIPVLIVNKPNINTVNNTLLTIYAAQEKGLNVRGVIINNIENDCSSVFLTSITRIIEEYTNVKILGIVPNLGQNILPEERISGLLNGIDIESIFDTKIEKLILIKDKKRK